MLPRLMPAAWFVALLSSFVVCLYLSWNLLASQNYGYHYFYDLYDVGAHIEKYGPQNRHIHGFETTGREQHERLFAEIVDAVHHQGTGLADIQFLRDGEYVSLLRQPEVVHLQDVANLIDGFQMLGLLSTLVMLGLGGWLLMGRSQPSWKHQLFILLGLIAGATLATLIIGPKAVFYQFHVWMFPPDHEWFFYYQDSLMTTLMHAPQIFGGIAVTMLIGALLLFAGLLSLIIKHRKRDEPM